MRIFLDDERFPAPDSGAWLISRSAEHAIHLVENFCSPGKLTFVSFDHDLGPDQKTGMDFARYLVEKDIDSGGTFLPSDFSFYVHSQNPVGKENIERYLAQYLLMRS